MTEIDPSFVDETIEEIGRGSASVIPILQAIQEQYRYLPQSALQRDPTTEQNGGAFCCRGKNSGYFD